MKKVIHVLLVLLLVAQSALAADYYVATTGNNSNIGSIGSPFLTIQKCATVMVAGDNCIVRGGLYDAALGGTYGVVPHGTSYSNAITFKNYPGETVTQKCTFAFTCFQLNSDTTGIARDFYWIIEADAVGNWVIDGDSGDPGVCRLGVGGSYDDHVRMSKVEIKNVTADGLLPGGNSWELLDMYVHHNGTVDGCEGGRADHGLYWTGSNLLLVGGRYDHNSYYGIQIFNSGHCILPGDADCLNDNIVANVRLDHNLYGLILLTGNRQTAVNVTADLNTNDGVHINYRCDDCRVLQSTIVGNGGGSIGIGNSSGGGTNSVIKNNIFRNNGAGDPISDLGTGTVQSNNYTGGSPGFTNLAAADYTLTMSSAAIAYGTDLSAYCTGDLIIACSDASGVARGTSPDAGMDQFGVGSPPSISATSPDTGVQGATVAISITGASTNFVNATSVCSISGSGVTVTSTPVSSPTAAVCNIVIDSNATVGARTITMTTGGEVVAATNALTITSLISKQLQMFLIH